MRTTPFPYMHCINTRKVPSILLNMNNPGTTTPPANTYHVGKNKIVKTQCPVYWKIIANVASKSFPHSLFSRQSSPLSHQGTWVTIRHFREWGGSYVIVSAKTFHVRMQILAYFQSLKSHNSVSAHCNATFAH